MSEESVSGRNYHIGLKLAGLSLLLPLCLAAAGVIPAEGEGLFANVALVWGAAGVLGVAGLWLIWKGR